MLIYKRLFIMILSLTYLVALLVSCAKPGDGDDANGDAAAPSLDGITSETISFSEITYSRPDTIGLYSELSSAAMLVHSGDADADDIIKAVKSAESAYSSYLTMLAYTELMYSKDSGDVFYASEYRVLKKTYADVFAAKERLAYEIMRSEHRDQLMEIGFADATPFRIDKWNRITDDYFSLLGQEEKLKYSFTLLSEDNVYITYDGITDTYSGTINRLKESLGGNTQSLIQASDECAKLYDKALTEKKLDIFLGLVKTRELISDSLGYDSYNEYASDLLGYSHTADEYQKYTADVFDYLSPVYNDLSIKIFNPYFNNNVPKLLDKNTLLSNLLSMYKSIDDDIYSAFGGMISSELYDIAGPSENRSNNSYTAYFSSLHTPFLFNTSYADARDYLTVAHGFGDYLDTLLYKGTRLSPLDAEISARLLATITLSSTIDTLDTDEGKHVYYFSIRNAMKEMLKNGFLSLAEHEIYNMDADGLSEDSIATMIMEIAEKHSVHQPEITDIVSRDLVLNPKSTQGKALSAYYASTIYFDKGNAESPLQIYNALLYRKADTAPESVLSGFGISSPFDDGAVMELSDRMFYSINGYHYYKNNSAAIPVA